MTESAQLVDPQPPEPAAERDASEIIPRQRPIVSAKELLLQLVIVTAGVLIALLIDSLVEWNHYRTLVREARTNISREIGESKSDVENILAAIDGYQKDLSNALRFANDLLRDRKTEIDSVQFNFRFAELISAAWRSAERTGALSHMDYAEVQRYSRLYDLQDVFVEHQRSVLREVTLALAVIAEGDPMQAAASDLERFRGHVRTLIAEVDLLRQLALQLIERYQEVLSAR